MMEPIDLQTVIIRGVDAASQVNQMEHQTMAAQQNIAMTQMQQVAQETRQVNRSNIVREKNVGSSTEGGGGGTYTPSGKRERKRKDSLVDDLHGRVLDVRL